VHYVGHAKELRLSSLSQPHKTKQQINDKVTVRSDYNKKSEKRNYCQSQWYNCGKKALLLLNLK